MNHCNRPRGDKTASSVSYRTRKRGCSCELPFQMDSLYVLVVVLMVGSSSIGTKWFIRCWTGPAFFCTNRSRSPNSWWFGQTDSLYQAVERKVVRSCYFEGKTTVMGIKCLFKRLLRSIICRSKLHKQVTTTIISICKIWLQGFLGLGTCKGQSHAQWCTCPTR